MHAFAAYRMQVVFSSCILYNNFVTIQQRRLQAQIEQEHQDRIIMVDRLKNYYKEKVCLCYLSFTFWHAFKH